jgi:UDP-N-acetylglucosamine 2-epimerase (non-hydrolysing)
MHILHVVGARPNFMKAAPVIRALRKSPDARQTPVHTGQHYDKNLSDIFFSQLNMPEPDVNLEVGFGSHAVQTAEVMKRFEPVVLERQPDIVLVYGDVNSTVAAALVCSKLLVRVGHVEMEPIIPPPCQIPKSPKIQPPNRPPRIPRMMSTTMP